MLRFHSCCSARYLYATPGLFHFATLLPFPFAALLLFSLSAALFHCCYFAFPRNSLFRYCAQHCITRYSHMGSLGLRLPHSLAYAGSALSICQAGIGIFAITGFIAASALQFYYLIFQDYFAYFTTAPGTGRAGRRPFWRRAGHGLWHRHRARRFAALIRHFSHR